MNGTGTFVYVRGYERALMEYTAYRVHKHLITYVPPVIVLLGTVGNLLSVAILCRKPLRHQPTYCYLATLSAADTIVLYVGLMRLWIGEIGGRDVRDLSDWSCRIVTFLGYAVSDLSAWLIIAVTLERFVAVRFPFRASGSGAGRQRALLVAGSLLAVLSLVNGHFFWSVRIVHLKHADGYAPTCHSTEPYIWLIDDIWPWVDAFIYSFVPFVAILILNALIIGDLLRARRRRVVLGSVQCRRKCSSAGDGSCDGGRMTVMLLVISLTFLVTTLPMNVALIATKIVIKRRRQVALLVRLRLVLTVTELLMYVNHSVNFLLYCAAGRRFRAEFLALVGRRKSVAGQHPPEVSGALSRPLHIELIKPNQDDDVKTPQLT